MRIRIIPPLLLLVACSTADEDGDGFNAVEDCNDNDASVYPGAQEVCNDVDDDCNDLVDDDPADPSTFYTDGDEDGHGDASAPVEACTLPAGAVEDDSDCDDTDAAVYPGAQEVCNGVDDDCDEQVDVGASNAPTWYRDADEDSFGDPGTAMDACDQPDGWVSDDTDCDDGDDAIFPGAEEVCNELDDDCDDDIDEGLDIPLWYHDADGDSYGDPTRPATQACEVPANHVADATDCDDGDAATYPGAEETHDQADNDCDDLCDEGFIEEGDLVVTELLYDPDEVADADGQWVEFFNDSGVDLALCGGWTLTDGGSDTHDLALDGHESILLGPGDYLVLGVSTDTATNGGAPVDYAYGGDFTLDSDADSIVIAFDGDEIDEFSYDDEDYEWARYWEPGFARQLDPAYTVAPKPEVFNDNYENWCSTYTTYGDGDRGTPGAENDYECYGGSGSAS